MSFSAPRFASELFPDPYGASHYGTIIEDRDFGEVYCPATGVYGHPYDAMHQCSSIRTHLTLVPTVDDDGMAGWSILPQFGIQSARDYSWFQQIINNTTKPANQGESGPEPSQTYLGPLVLDGSGIEHLPPPHRQFDTASDFEAAPSSANQELDWAHLPHLPSEDELDIPISSFVNGLHNESANKLELHYNPQNPDNLCIREDGQIYFANEAQSDSEAVFDDDSASEDDSDTSFGGNDYQDDDDDDANDDACDVSGSSPSLSGSETSPEYSSSHSSGQDDNENPRNDSNSSITIPATFNISGSFILLGKQLIADLDPAILNVGPRQTQAATMELMIHPGSPSMLQHDSESTKFWILDSAILDVPSLAEQPVKTRPASRFGLPTMLQETFDLSASSVLGMISPESHYDANLIEAEIVAVAADNTHSANIDQEPSDPVFDDPPSFVWGIEDYQIMDDPAVSMIMPSLTRETVVDPANDKVHLAQLVARLRATAPAIVDTSFLGRGFEYTMPLLFDMLKKHVHSPSVHHKKPDLFADPAIAVVFTPLMDGLCINVSSRAEYESHFAGLIRMLRASGAPNPVKKEAPAPAPTPAPPPPEVDFNTFYLAAIETFRQQMRDFDDKSPPPRPHHQGYGPEKPSPFGAPGCGRPKPVPKTQTNKSSSRSAAKKYSPTLEDLLQFAHKEAADIPVSKNEGFGLSPETGPSVPEAPFIFGRGKTVPRAQAGPTAPPSSPTRRPKIATNAELVDDLLFGIPTVPDAPPASILPPRRTKIATNAELVDDLLFGIPTVWDTFKATSLAEEVHVPSTQPTVARFPGTLSTIAKDIEDLNNTTSGSRISDISATTIIHHDVQDETKAKAEAVAYHSPDAIENIKPFLKLPVKVKIAAGLKDRVATFMKPTITEESSSVKQTPLKRVSPTSSRVASQVSEINRKISGPDVMPGLSLATPARPASKSSRISSLASNFERKESDSSSALRGISGNSLSQSRLSDSVKSLASRFEELSRFSSLATTVSMVSDKAEKEASVVQDSQIDAVVDKESFVSATVGRVIATELSTPDSKQISPSAFRIFSPEAATIKKLYDNRRPIPRGKVTILSGIMGSVTTDDNLEDEAAIEATHSPIETRAKKATKVSKTPTHATPVSKKRVPKDTSSGQATVPGASSIPHHALPTVSSAAKARPLVHKAVEALKSGSVPTKKTKAIPPLPPMKSKDLPKPTIIATANVELQHPRPARVISPPWAGLRRE